MNFTLGWWLIPLAVTVWLIHWCLKQDYSGDYNFMAMFTVPVTCAGVCFTWLIYAVVRLATT